MAASNSERNGLQEYTHFASVGVMKLQRVPMASASRLGVSKVASQSANGRIALTSHGRVVAVVDSAERLDEDIRLMRESAAAVLDAAADLVSSLGKRLSLDETCARLGIDPDRVRARAAEKRKA